MLFQGLLGRISALTFHTPVDGGFFACVLLWAEAVGVLVDSQFEQRREHLAAEVAAVSQLLLVRPNVLQELIQLLEGLGAGLQHTLINLLPFVLGQVGLELEVGLELAGAELALVGAVNHNNLFGLSLALLVLVRFMHLDLRMPVLHVFSSPALRIDLGLSRTLFQLSWRLCLSCLFLCMCLTGLLLWPLLLFTLLLLPAPFILIG